VRRTATFVRISKRRTSGANLREATLSGATLHNADLGGAKLYNADLENADLTQADLHDAVLYKANLSRAFLTEVNLTDARLHNADLSGADLQAATLVDTCLIDVDLTGCRIYGVSAWNLHLENVKQQNLVLTPPNEPEITVDNIEVAQFIYLLLHNQKIRDVIDTIGKKGVLLLGRFTEGRIHILERLRDKLRSLGFVPMVFNFDKPETKRFHRDGPVAG
jgi:hypothetical protein